MEQLNLLVPGLIADASSFPFKNCYQQADMANIEKLLARAERRWNPCASQEAQIWQCLTGEQTAPPIAATSRLGEGSDKDLYYWLRLDPVYLHTDRDSLLMFPNNYLTLSLEEARQLASEVMHHFRDLAWHIEVAHPLRWYLRLSEDPEIVTTELASVIGKAIFHYLPTGPKAKRWRSLLNEIQMLLHASQVNQARIARGEQAINALWAWGGGRLPAIRLDGWRVYGGGVYAQGVATMGDAAWQEAVDDYRSLGVRHRQGDKLLVILDDLIDPLRRQDETEWLKAFTRLDNGWFAPLRQALKRQEIKTLDVYCGSGRVFTTTAKMQKRFWTPRQSLLNYAETNNSKADRSAPIN